MFVMAWRFFETVATFLARPASWMTLRWPICSVELRWASLISIRPIQNMELELHVAPLGFGRLDFLLGFRQFIVESGHLII